jgi:hypothetical protein
VIDNLKKNLNSSSYVEQILLAVCFQSHGCIAHSPDLTTLSVDGASTALFEQSVLLAVIISCML